MNSSLKCLLYPRPRKGKKYYEVLRKIDNLAEIAGAFGRTETARKMKQIVPEYKCMKSGDEGMDGVGEGVVDTWLMKHY